MYAHINPEEAQFLEKLHGVKPTQSSDAITRLLGQLNSKDGQDSILAKIVPSDIPWLKSMGGSGRLDPLTGKIHFDDGDGTNGEGADGYSDTNNGDFGNASFSNDLQSYTQDIENNFGGYDGQDNGGNLSADTSMYGNFAGWVDGPSETGNEFNSVNGTQNPDAGTFDNSAIGPSGGWQDDQGLWNWDLGQMLGFNMSPNNPSFDHSLDIQQQEEDLATGKTSIGPNGIFGPQVASWLNENKGIMGLLQTGLTLANPFAGAAFGLANNAGKGNTFNSITGLASMFGAPSWATAGMGAINGLTTGHAGNVAAGIGSNALNGISPGLGTLANATGLTGLAGNAINSGLTDVSSTNTASAGESTGGTSGSGGNSGAGGGGSATNNISTGLASLLGLSSMADMTSLLGSGSTANGTGSSIANWLGLLASLYGSNKSVNGYDASQSLAQNVSSIADPFGSQRPQYQQLLSQSYSDPQSVYNNNYKAQDQTFFDQLQAQNSANGRATDAYKNGVSREAAFENYLNNYRAGLALLAQGNANTSAAALSYGDIMKGALANQQNAQQGVGYSLGSLLGGTGTNGQANNGLNSLLGIVGKAGSTVSDWLSGLFNTGSTTSDSSFNDPSNYDSYIGNDPWAGFDNLDNYG